MRGSALNDAYPPRATRLTKSTASSAAKRVASDCAVIRGLREPPRRKARPSTSQPVGPARYTYISVERGPVPQENPAVVGRRRYATTGSHVMPAKPGGGTAARATACQHPKARGHATTHHPVPGTVVMVPRPPDLISIVHARHELGDAHKQPCYVSCE